METAVELGMLDNQRIVGFVAVGYEAYNALKTGNKLEAQKIIRSLGLSQVSAVSRQVPLLSWSPPQLE